jgi:hypothetical protein
MTRPTNFGRSVPVQSSGGLGGNSEPDETLALSIFVPYFIAEDETFTVPEYKQAVSAMTIDVEGSLVVDGYLIEVD